MTIEKYQEITSSENSQLKLLGKLSAKKYRQEFGLFMVENLTIIIDALKDGHDFESLFITQEFADKHAEDIEFLEQKSKSENFYIITSRLNKSYSELDTPSGITAIYKIKERELDSSSVIYLNGISDPGNLGAIFRLALAFDFANIIVDENCVDIYNSKVINAAKDSFFKLNIKLDKGGKWLQDNKLPVYATSSHSGTNLAEFRPSEAFCLVLGSESHGISPEIMKLVEKTIKIEMSSRIESLNVATAAAILLYELKKK